MINYLSPGKVMTYTVPASGVTTGGGYLIGALFVVATNTVAYASGATFEGQTEGVFTLPKTISEGDLAEGQPLYWDVANAKVTIDPSLGLPIGTLAEAADTADTTCSVRLNGVSLAGRLMTVRKRFAIAAINAGATLIPALPGLKIRMVDAMVIAVGGAVGATTTVDIQATQGASGVKLVACAQAGLTRSTVLRAGDASSAVLADGASFVANDVSTAVTVGKTGATATVATHIDVSLTYSLE
jgi:predicted RecA/RadA family phage recombinase